MAKKARAQNLPGPNARLSEALKRLEGRVKALETGFTEHDGRLQKVEVVKAGPQDPAVMDPARAEPPPG